ncbi:hypothetical protein [Streptomyces sp. Ag109_G2-15]|uniref:hypothetical protein n=1 Tax=Streptomyces sp. Ag109_G2-15 TaxID=1938850 RepID=UPI000BC51024|nr:hypothetical protein [Streptomyces sp. Ag109_G2-15]SOD84961.1 hypothetical protein SAMN06272765_2357 [Streptomyces sp. Ag109_G2-15]
MASDADRIDQLLGALLIELGEKIRQAGAEGVRILTDEELQRSHLQWYRMGWEEHARAVRPYGPPHSATAPPPPHRGDASLGSPPRSTGSSSSADPSSDASRPSGHPADPDPLTEVGRLLSFPRSGRTHLPEPDRGSRGRMDP